MSEWLRRFIRGPQISRLLAAFNIEPRRYWLLMDLFANLSERGEMLDQLGRDGVALKTVSWLYFAMSALMSLLLLIANPPLVLYISNFLILTSIFLLSVLISETSNSLVNPEEGFVLAHQPINGASYTAAKLTHLARVIFFLVPGLNAIPAFAGLTLKDARWWYPIVHLAAAFALGFLAALLCCALFGWLIRLVPPQRLKAVAQLVTTLPLLSMIWLGPIREFLGRARITKWAPSEPIAQWGLIAAFTVVAVVIVALGIRALSADFLIRVSSMTRGGSAAGARVRGGRMGAVVARFFGGQAARAGFQFVSRLMLRDWHFRRQVMPMMLVSLVGLAPVFAGGWRVDPLSGEFTPIHFVPHVFAFVLFYICSFLPYGSDHKAAWVFLLAPSGAIRNFATGLYALFLIHFVLIPHSLLFAFFIWRWGLPHACLFVAYSTAVVLFYLALELRLIDALPFSKPVDAARGALLLPVMLLGGFAMAIAVGLQYFLVFQSPTAVIFAAALIAVAAYFVTRSSLTALEGAMRFNLAVAAEEFRTLYKEVA